VARYLGSAFIGIGVVSRAARNTASDEAKRAIVLGFFVVAVTGLIVAFFGFNIWYGERPQLVDHYSLHLIGSGVGLLPIYQTCGFLMRVPKINALNQGEK
jgi:uncharacterized membrane protein YGL010W